MPWVTASLLFSQRDKKRKCSQCPFCMVFDMVDRAAATSICYETVTCWTVRPFYISLLQSHVKSALVGGDNIPANMSHLNFSSWSHHESLVCRVCFFCNRIVEFIFYVVFQNLASGCFALRTIRTPVYCIDVTIHTFT